MADGKYQSQGWDWEGFKPEAEKVRLGLRPATQLDGGPGDLMI